MEVHLLAIQARVMLIVGFVYLAVGLYLGTDPATLAWRTALASTIAMIGSGKLLHYCSAVIQERMAVDIAERQLAAEQAQAAVVQTPAEHLRQQMHDQRRTR